MNFNKKWTAFALEAEYELYGMVRISKEHEQIIRKLEEANKNITTELLKHCPNMTFT